MSGAGKSRLVERTVELLGDASRLHFDHYDSVSQHPPNLKEWMEQGADVNEWETPQLADDLRKLRRGESVQLPQDFGVVEPAAFIVVEEPFGRSRRETAELIDFAAHLLVPPDVLLVRRILRRIEEERDQFGDRLIERLQRDLQEYLSAGRDLYALGCDSARQAADLVLDGMKSVDAIADTLVAEIHARRKAT